jgi:hypothetical protein
LLGNPFNPLGRATFEVVSPVALARLKKMFLERKSEVFAVVKTLTQDPEGPSVMNGTLEHFDKTFVTAP